MRHRALAGAACVALLAAVTGCSGAGGDEAATGKPALTYQTVRPILERACLGCHQPGGAQEASDLRNYHDVADGREMIRMRLIARSMPPEGAAVRLTDAERKLILDWIEAGAKR
jgi:uncharacterized membrane protein